MNNIREYNLECIFNNNNEILIYILCSNLKIKSRILEETNLIVGEQKERIRWLEEELKEQIHSISSFSKKRKRNWTRYYCYS